MSQKINLATAPRADGTLYPPPYDEPCRARRRIKLGDAAGLTQLVSTAASCRRALGRASVTGIPRQTSSFMRLGRGGARNG